MPRALLASVVVILAGCTGGPFLPGSENLAFEAAVRLPTDDGTPPEAFEPSVVVDSAGRVIVTAARGIRASTTDPSATAHASRLWSSDDGVVFRIVEPAGVPFGAEGHLAISTDDVAYFADLTLQGVPVARSTDGGATWELRAQSANAVPGGDRQWIAAGARESVVVVWNQLASGLWVFASEDGALTFPVQTHVPGAEDLIETSAPAIAPDGSVLVVRAEAEGPALYASADGARSFTRTLAWRAEGRTGWIMPSVVVDDAGTVYVSTVERLEDGLARVRYAFSKDTGATFSAPREVSVAPGSHAMQWAAAGRAGELAIAFYENPEGTGTPDEASGEWFVRVARSLHADTEDATFVESRAAAEAVHEGAICTAGLSCPDDGSRGLGDYLGIDLGKDGAVHVVWTTSAQRAVWYSRALSPS